MGPINKPEQPLLCPWFLMTIQLKRVLSITLGIWLANVCLPSHASTAVDAATITKAEWALLPPYCPYTLAYKGYGSPNRAKWDAMMGPENFIHMHHYCWALIRYQRAGKAGISSTQRRHLRAQALDDFLYVQRNASQNFVLLPELLTWIGKTELSLGNSNNADPAFAKAREIKADYWPAYTHWAEFLIASGRREEAMATVKAGLQHAPTAKVLLELFKALGGKPEDMPPPMTKQEETPAS